nr:EAL domain-containing protein [uncultured Rhodopila sp.]
MPQDSNVAVRGKGDARSRRKRWRVALLRPIGVVKLSNWPFALKMAFCPLLAAVALIGMGLHGIMAADDQAALIRTVIRDDLATAMELSASATELQEINSSLYRLTTLQASRSSNLDVKNGIDGLVARTAALAEALGTRGAAAAGADRAELLDVAAKVRMYRDAIDVFGSMLEIDFDSAVEFFRPFDRNASEVLGLINAITDRSIHEANSRARTSALIAERIRHALVAASAGAILVLFGVASLLTRATVRSVRRIAAATENVARGGAQVDIEALARGDELGTIVRSLAVFQANVSQIAFLAHHDPLTRLPNRILFHDRIQQALARVDRGHGFAVLCLDLDRFKMVNDTLGHPIGDVLLRQVAERLQACVREGDSVARLGGDEFAVILLNLDDPAAVDALATRIIEVVSTGYEVEGHQISIGTSIGMALSPADGTAPYELLKKADTALYGAKANGRGTACFYEDAMNAALQSRRELEIGLRQALAQDEFQMNYQPLVDARSHHVCGFEALIRWHHPEKGVIPPDAFIPIAESTGLIMPIGEWVLRRSCLDAASWPGDIKLAVNLSPSQFKDRHLVRNVRAALAVSGLAPQRLELEITESVLLTDSNVTLAILHEIKALGVHISMDDFGTGYSSLSYLRSFPFDKVKIDRSFIKDLPNDRNAMAIVRAIVGLSTTFGMSVTAEGVETDEQAVQLALEECDQLQGFLFSKPIPAAGVHELIETLSPIAAR